MDDQFNPVTATPVVDPTKHVNYTYGMVLGVDDFTQEFVYHSERDQWATRDIDGYGTVSGLRVTLAENAAGEREVIVSAGAAVNPRGQLICVPAAQCAVVERWLAVAANRREAERALEDAPPGSALGLYVVLCYRDCPVDQVPIPGEPCRDEGETVAPSRLKDDFRLELRTAPPAQQEERAVREFVRWLREHVEFTDDPGDGFTDEDSFVAALRAYAESACQPSPDSPPSSPLEESPPHVMRVESALRCDFLNTAFRLWVTEVRPRCRPAFLGSHCSCSGESHAHEAAGGDEDCVLLAELRVPVTADLLVDPTQPVLVSERDRPVLLHQRLLQEWLLCGSCCAEGVAAAAAADTGEFVSPPPPPPPETPAELVSLSQSSFGDDGGEISYMFWFHPDPADQRPVVQELTDESMSVFTATGGELALAPEFKVSPVEGQANVFQVTVSGGPFPQLGFTLHLDNIFVRTTRVTRPAPLSDYAQKRRLRYVGQYTVRGEETQRVTIYAPPPVFFRG